MLVDEITRLHRENYGVYGIRKIRALLTRHCWVVGRDQTARLMKLAGVTGATRTDARLVPPADPVKRDFSAPTPKRLWVVGITYVRILSGQETVKSRAAPHMSRLGKR